MNRDILRLVAAIGRAANYSSRFTNDERAAMVELLSTCLGSLDRRLAIRAAEAVIRLDRANLEAERLSFRIDKPPAFGSFL